VLEARVGARRRGFERERFARGRPDHELGIFLVPRAEPADVGIDLFQVVRPANADGFHETYADLQGKPDAVVRRVQPQVGLEALVARLVRLPADADPANRHARNIETLALLVERRPFQARVLRLLDQFRVGQSLPLIRGNANLDARTLAILPVN